MVVAIGEKSPLKSKSAAKLVWAVIAASMASAVGVDVGVVKLSVDLCRGE